MAVLDRNRLTTVRALKDIGNFTFTEIGIKLGLSRARAHQIYHDNNPRIVCDHILIVAYEYQFPGGRAPGYRVACSLCEKLMMWVNRETVKALGFPIIKEEG